MQLRPSHGALQVAQTGADSPATVASGFSGVHAWKEHREHSVACGVQIRNATYHDLPRIMEIEKLSFPQPWSLNSFRRELSLPFSRLIVASSDDHGSGTVDGFLCRWLVADESHILNIAVHPGTRRSGLGTVLLDQAIEEARTRQVQVVTLEVRRSNLPARNLYRKFAFEERRLRRNYYGPGEDALVMELCLTVVPGPKMIKHRFI